MNRSAVVRSLRDLKPTTWLGTLVVVAAVLTIGVQIPYPLTDDKTQRVLTIVSVVSFFAASVLHALDTRGPRIPSLRLRFRVLARDGFRCRVCGRSPAVEAGVLLHVDHIIAWSAGGSSTLDNLQTLCDRCNLGKADEPITETDA